MTLAAEGQTIRSDRKMRAFGLSFFVSCVAVLAGLAQAPPPSQVELNGFLLGQYAQAPDRAFGKPAQVGTDEDHWTYRAYLFDEKYGAYMAFRFPPDDHQRMLSIQIAGNAGTPMRPFLGLVIGDDKQKVLQALGNPEKIEPEKEYPVDLYTYANRNYSVEINRKGKLSSIQIMGYAGFAEKPPSGLPDIEGLRRFIVNHDIDGLLTVLAGDLEIYRGDHAYSFSQSARAELADQETEIGQLLFGDKAGLLAAFTAERFDPDEQIRLYEKAPPGCVVKFAHSKIVREVVYKAEAGSWKVWEIALR